MTQKERLVELLRLEYGSDTWLCSTECGVFSSHTRITDIETVADYLLKNGVIVPPCKVGDVLYYMLNDGTIQDRTVDEIALNKHGLCIWAGIALVEQNQLGQSVFLTREEAEQALKECDDQ